MPDKLKMLIVGYARGHTFAAPGIIARIGRRAFPEIKVRPSIFKGLNLHLDPSDLSHLTVAEEILLDQVYDLALVPFVPSIVLDCGAHTGAFTLLAAVAFPSARLICFEPDPANFLWLERQIRGNQLTVELIPAAVSTVNGKAEFDAGQGCGSALHTGLSPLGERIEVDTVDLAEYVTALNGERLLLKLDVEGAEEEILPRISGVLPNETFLFFETHGGETSWNCLRNLLSEQGFIVKATRRRGIYTDGTAVRAERRCSSPKPLKLETRGKSVS